MFNINGLNAQIITVNAKLDTNLILIGDQIGLTLEVSHPKSFELNFPVFNDTIIDKVEIIESSDIDTSFNDNYLNLKQQYLITCFDSGIYVLPPFNFTFKSEIDGQIDTIKTVPVYLGVQTLKLDTTNAIADIKVPFEAPVTIKEVLPYILSGLLLAAIVLFIIYYIKKRKKHEPIIKKKVKPRGPAHLIALKELDKLKEKKLWQKNKTKLYHSKLTEIIRVYIEYRFDIMAMEKTTYEILTEFENSGLIEEKTYENLKQMLVLADFVKFAKVNPLPDENEKCLNNAYFFVDKTKPVLKLEENKTTEAKEPVSTGIE